MFKWIRDDWIKIKRTKVSFVPWQEIKESFPSWQEWRLTLYALVAFWAVAYVSVKYIL